MPRGSPVSTILVRVAPEREEWRNFLLRVCHDLRTSLRAVRINAELLANPEKRGPDVEQILGFLVDGARNADFLVEGISNYALALHVQPYSFQPVSTEVLLRRVLAKLAPEIRASGAQITHDPLPKVTGDLDRLAQVFDNLLRNAIQHRAEEDPRIHVGAQEQTGRWLFTVHDNGPGIDAADLERIFRPFERLRSNHRGAGLGLTICRAVVAAHGGQIWADSQAGRGTTFYFTLETA